VSTNQIPFTTETVSTARTSLAKETLRVSIVIPAYNHARYLDEAVESVLEQDYPAVELVVIDDGSTDNTREVLQKYAGRFQILRQDNSGQAATLNRGWQLASGDILGYLSADDMLRPRAVARAVAALAGNPRAVAAYPDFCLIDLSSAVIRTVRTDKFDYRRVLTEFNCPPGPGAFFRRSALQTAGGWNTALRQMPDFDFWLRLGLVGELIRIEEVLAGFRVHPGSLTFGVVEAARADEPIRIVAAILADPRLPADIAAMRDVAWANANIVSAQLHLRAGRVREARRRARAAYEAYPRSIVSVRFARALFNAVVNRTGHRLLWTLRAMFQRAR
jgi:glycosyltransferase involved in cell wall biosynthesis